LLILLLCLAAFVQINSGAHARDYQFGQMRAFIQKQMLERQAPSVAVAVARDGKIIWEEAFGWANREERIAATPHTMYSLASSRKPGDALTQWAETSTPFVIVRPLANSI
jgi:CubicO group peptidase (beta-lactamase class C family)